MICPKCGNVITHNSYFDAYYCPRCGEFIREKPPMTNADRIRAMSDMELAQWLASKIANLKFLDVEMSGKQLTSTEKEALTHDLYVVFDRYLKQPAEEDDHA